MNNIIETKAFSPSHITGLFQIFKNGSTGAGLNTIEGAISKVTLLDDNKNNLLIKINDEESKEAIVSNKVVSSYSDYIQNKSLVIEHQIMAPIGYGLGMSGAGSYSLSIALNKALGSPLNNNQVMEVAKYSEIQSGTGLGDVVAQQFPGIMMGLKPYPSTEVKQISYNNEKVICGYFAPLETAKYIRSENWIEKINKIGGECMGELEKSPTLENFIKLSRYFSFETGLANDTIKKVMNDIPNSSMAMLGQTIFVISEKYEEIKKELLKFTDRVSISEISKTGATIIE